MLTDKSLKYTPEITLEIFTLVWNKLIENGWSHRHEESIHECYLGFSTKYQYFAESATSKMFKCYSYSSGDPTTAQEILGYDPFVKDDFVLPEKWCIKRNRQEINDWLNKNKQSNTTYSTIDSNFVHYPTYDGVNHLLLYIQNGYTEITFDQFKKYVLKESIEEPKVESKEVIPEYVECIESADESFIAGKIYKCEENSTAEEPCLIKENGYISSLPWDGNLWKFKPSTKEAFDAQNQSKSIEKWSVGSYVVFLEGEIQNNGYKKGEVQRITFHGYGKIDLPNGCGNTISSEEIASHIKWFATKSEAEEFAKTLIEPVKERVETSQLGLNEWLDKYKKLNLAVNDLANAIELSNFDKVFLKLEGTNSKEKANILYDQWNFKQPLKQAVHCKTQEEWDFVLSKFNPLKLDSSHFNRYKSNSIIIFSEEIDKDYYGAYSNKNETIFKEILSFQEWCDLNGYKMEKEVKFEVGKWYKAYYAEKIYFLKYKNTIPRNGYNQINYSEFINNGVYKINDSISNTDLENSFKVLDDLEEIQQYLPDNHPDKIKSNQEFKVGDWVYSFGNKKLYQLKTEIGVINSKNYPEKYRHATPEEINNHLISIGQIPTSEPLNNGIEPNKDGMFKYTTVSGTSFGSNCSSAISYSNSSSKPKMLLSIDDEELPMVNVIKTNSIKQLLNND